MNFSSRRDEAFSLVELLVVIGMVGALMAILLPVIARIRSSANTARCLSNLRQLGQAHQAYVVANGNRLMPRVNGNDPKHFEWWDVLAPQRGGARAVILCPEAVAIPPGPSHPGWHFKLGSAHECWRIDRSGVCCSYALNGYMFASLPGDWGFSSGYFLRPPARESARIPIFADCRDIRAYGPQYCTIDRHRTAINIIFMDGHGERVPLADLTKLKWSATYDADAR